MSRHHPSYAQPKNVGPMDKVVPAGPVEAEANAAPSDADGAAVAVAPAAATGAEMTAPGIVVKNPVADPNLAPGIQPGALSNGNPVKISEAKAADAGLEQADVRKAVSPAAQQKQPAAAVADDVAKALWGDFVAEHKSEMPVPLAFEALPAAAKEAWARFVVRVSARMGTALTVAPPGYVLVRVRNALAGHGGALARQDRRPVRQLPRGAEVYVPQAFYDANAKHLEKL